MKLHRSSNRPQWQDIPLSERTVWQRTAAHTGSVVTSGNVLTLLGLAMVLAGLVRLLEDEYWPGLILLAAGRFCDLADGWLAEITRTKSPLGELLDASADKLATLLSIIVLVKVQAAAWWFLVLLLSPQLLAVIIAGYHRAYGHELHPSSLGKLSMAALWLALVGFVLGLGLHQPVALSVAAYVSAGASIVSGYIAAVAYARARPAQPKEI